MFDMTFILSKDRPNKSMLFLLELDMMANQGAGPSSSGLCKASTARIDCSKQCTWELLWVPAQGHLIQTLAAVWLLAMCTLGD